MVPRNPDHEEVSVFYNLNSYSSTSQPAIIVKEARIPLFPGSFGGPIFLSLNICVLFQIKALHYGLKI
jgi:hypothetical protein